MRTTDILSSWGKVLLGHTPMLSIEVTRECPLHCPGCYAYGDNHLGGEVTLRELSDKRDDELVAGVLGLIDRHKPMHVTLVGGEPMVRHRELSRILPVLAKRRIFSMVVTSGIIPLPMEWMDLPLFTAAISIDGLPEHHNVRRHPATYDRILANIAGRKINVHWTITAQMLAREGYLEEYARFWSERPEVNQIWVSLYTPQRGEESAERLTPEQRTQVAQELARLHTLYPKLLTAAGYTQTMLNPPASPKECTFSRLSKNYSADFKTHVEPCVFGGNPDCSQCGCSASVAAHWVSQMKIAGPLTPGHIMRASLGIGNAMARLQDVATPSWRQREQSPSDWKNDDLVQITGDRVA
ncbi:MAG: radical SAM protein [Acidobacteriota bacterium]